MTENPIHTLADRRILVVEDERLIALDISDMLQDWGCRVIGPVATAEAALELIAEDLPDCALLDVQLARGTTEPVAAALRSGHRPFLILTAFQRGHLTGALVDAPLLNKPVDEKKLKKELCSLLSTDIPK